MEYEVSVWERLTLGGALPPTGNLWEMRIVRELRDELGFTEGELADLQFKEENGRARWEPNAVPPKSVEIGPVALGIIRASLPALIKQLHEAEMITIAHLDLCDRFDVEYGIEPEEESEESEQRRGLAYGDHAGQCRDYID